MFFYLISKYLHVNMYPFQVFKIPVLGFRNFWVSWIPAFETTHIQLFYDHQANRYNLDVHYDIDINSVQVE